MIKVSTPFLPNGSRYSEMDIEADDAVYPQFQHLFFLMEVATLKNTQGYAPMYMFQHLFFLMEVATIDDSNIKQYIEFKVSTPFLPNGSRYNGWYVIEDSDEDGEFQHLFFLMEVATIFLLMSVKSFLSSFNTFSS